MKSSCTVKVFALYQASMKFVVGPVYNKADKIDFMLNKPQLKNE